MVRIIIVTNCLSKMANNVDPIVFGVYLVCVVGIGIFLSAQYLLNQWLDSYQISWIYNLDITKN